MSVYPYLSMAPMYVQYDRLKIKSANVHEERSQKYILDRVTQ